MVAENRPDERASTIALAIGEPARARMLYCLMDNHARTSTELAAVAEVSPSTASTHLNRLRAERLVKVRVQGKHRYHSLEGPEVAGLLESLSVVAGGSRARFEPSTPNCLRAARTCYDHMAGRLGVALHDRLKMLGCFSTAPGAGRDSYKLTAKGRKVFESLGVDLRATEGQRRQFAYGCLDWSERRPHLGGAMGAALLKIALGKKWVSQELDSRALLITRQGRREMLARFGLDLENLSSNSANQNRVN